MKYWLYALIFCLILVIPLYYLSDRQEVSARKISLKLNGSTIQEIVKEFSRVSNLNCTAYGNSTQFKKKHDIEISDQSVWDALIQISKKTNFGFQFYGDHHMVFEEHLEPIGKYTISGPLLWVYDLPKNINDYYGNSIENAMSIRLYFFYPEIQLVDFLASQKVLLLTVHLKGGESVKVGFRHPDEEGYNVTLNMHWYGHLGDIDPNTIVGISGEIPYTHNGFKKINQFKINLN